MKKNKYLKPTIEEVLIQQHLLDANSEPGAGYSRELNTSNLFSEEP